jgi:hypothetical protein
LPSKKLRVRLTSFPGSSEQARPDSPFLLCSLDAWSNGGELSFKVVRLERAGQEVLARAGNFMMARAAFDTRAGFAQLGPILAPIKQQRSYRNRNATDTDHDEMTDLPFSLPLFPYQHPTDLMDLTVAPMPHTLWVFRFHVPELYAGATPATPII